MTAKALFSVIVIASCFVKAIHGLYCLQCDDVPSARDCHTIKKCAAAEVCYSTQIVSTSGHVYRRMGCRDKMQCTSGIVGKRSSRIEAGDLPVCDGCCDSLFCQSNLCQDQAIHGLYCLQCDDVPSARDCNTIKKCAATEVCYSTQIVSTSGHVYRRMGCRDKMQCTSGIVDKRSSRRDAGDLPVCDGCCDSLFCQSNLCQDQAIHVPYCLQCDDVPSARDCNTIKKCAATEVCYSTQIVSTSGHVYRRMGCRDKTQCTSGIVGKRSSKRYAGDLPVCDGCCDSLFCQPNLCQDQGFNKDRGPICFKCDHVANGDNCTQITECGRDQTCYSGITLSPGGSILTKLGCYSKSACNILKASIGTGHSASSCWDCCDSDLCNTGCGTQTASFSTKVPVTQKPNAASIHGDIHCLQCSDVVSARDCYQVKKCGPHQVCYSTTVVSATGRIFREMGCRDRVQCSKTIVGKRSPSRSTGDTPICDECCDISICQPKLCQDKDYAADRGPMCFKCDERAKNDPCDLVTECGRNSVCFTSFKVMPSGSLGLQTGCFTKSPTVLIQLHRRPVRWHPLLSVKTEYMHRMRTACISADFAEYVCDI
ncbi:uncharacterized protein LOC123542420 isoform X2 [Mercenaria mercenaria]|uniref:uncharacterized protein LOC123542420 isoform X2 n=1 Tax=Mercenaria mercenaria TaxID=6596 RepID=UPI00234FB0AA|nr:uncharacterized protein LOC123542420 isoform X2 [Mercenaria mercenaria]